MPGGGGEAGEPNRLRDRQPEREERRKGGIRIGPSGYDAGKKVTGKKRHILVDTLGLLLHAIVHPADIQDRDGGVLLLSTLFGMYPFLVKLFADAGYQGTKFADAVAKHLPHLAIEIVKRSDQAKGFVVLPMRWVSSAPWHGSIAAVGWPRTGSASAARRSPSCTGLPFA